MLLEPSRDASRPCDDAIFSDDGNPNFDRIGIRLQYGCVTNIYGIININELIWITMRRFVVSTSREEDDKGKLQHLFTSAFWPLPVPKIADARY